MWEKAKDFIKKAFTIIFIASMVIWFLQSFSWNLTLVADSSNSILASIGNFVAPIFKPMGFDDWRASIGPLLPQLRQASGMSFSVAAPWQVQLSHPRHTIQ